MTAKLGDVGSETILLIAIDSPKKIDSLPQEPLTKIFSFLSKKDLQAVALVNRSISSSVQVAANFNETIEIKNFIRVLLQRLNAEIFPDQSGALAKILNNVTSQNFWELRLLRGYILDVKAQLTNVIKTLDWPTANNLRDHVHLPHFFENIFDLAAFERVIDLANLILDEYERGQMFLGIFGNFARSYNIDKAIVDRAIVVATSIPDARIRSYAFENISKALTKVGNIDRAIVVAELILNESMTGSALKDISRALTKANNIDRAIVVATSIPDALMMSGVLEEISEALTKVGNIDRAIVVAESILEEPVKMYALSKIFRPLMKHKN